MLNRDLGLPLLVVANLRVNVVALAFEGGEGVEVGLLLVNRSVETRNFRLALAYCSLQLLLIILER